MKGTEMESLRGTRVYELLTTRVQELSNELGMDEAQPHTYVEIATKTTEESQDEDPKRGEEERREAELPDLFGDLFSKSKVTQPHTRDLFGDPFSSWSGDDEAGEREVAAPAATREEEVGVGRFLRADLATHSGVGSTDRGGIGRKVSRFGGSSRGDLATHIHGVNNTDGGGFGRHGEASRGDGDGGGLF